MEKKKVNLPQKGAGRRLAERIEKLGRQPPPRPLVDKLNKDDKKEVATPKASAKDLDL